VSGDWIELSKAVSHALRHEPWLYELELDDEGWTPVDALVTALSQEPRWRDLSRALAALMRKYEEVARLAARQHRAGLTCDPDQIYSIVFG